MKPLKYLLALLIGLQSFVSFAQLSVTKLDGTPINDGDILTFDSAIEPASYLGLKVFNNSNEDINVKVKCVDIVNADGTNVQLCFGPVCVPTITIGNSYPNIAAVIEANSSNGNFDHFLNLNTGINPNAPVLYTFKFYRVDDNNVEIGNSVTFSYRYVSALGVSSFGQLEQAGVSLSSTLVSNYLQMTATKNVRYTIYDVNGKALSSQALVSGEHTVNVSNLPKGVYILQFDSSDGQKGSVKVLKQ